MNINYPYFEEVYLHLSGIQHYAFCKRQWALIYLEQYWIDNERTVEGNQLHKKVDNPYIVETRGDIIVSRAVPIISHTLRLQGIADVVEFHRTEDEVNSVVLPKRKGFWKPVPIEYKRGKVKEGNIDMVQLCAQTICFEEMLGISIPIGYLFYGKINKRVLVEIDENLRIETKKLAEDMYSMLDAKITPKSNYGSYCESCSLLNICMPKLTTNKINVNRYIEKMLRGNY